MNVTRKLLNNEVKKIVRPRQFSICTVKRKDEQYIIKSTFKDKNIPDMRILDRLWIEADGFQKLVAVECAETKKSYTYEKLRRNAAVFATSLRKKFGLKQGDVVGVMLPNCPEFVAAGLGTIQAGCVLTTINPIYKEVEVTHQISIAQPKVMITIQECYDVIVKSMKNAKINLKIVIVDHPNDTLPDGTSRFTEIGENGDADYSFLDKIVRKPSDIAVIPFSSGTTGLPKGVEITHRNVIASIEIMADENICYPFLASNDFQDVLPVVTPFFHIYGFIVNLMGHMSKGSKFLTMRQFSTAVYFDMLKNNKSTLLYIVPPIAILLGKHPDVTKEHLQYARHICSGAAPLSASDVNLVMEKCNDTVHFNQGFGATETSSLTTGTPVKATNIDYAACGVAMPNIELKFVDPLSGKPVAIGETGEMYVRGPVVMKGYHRNEKATAESITEDGFFKTGDLGSYKPGAGLFITDRIKELIKVKGMQVVPAELESILRSHPSVADAAVIGVPHEFYGEAPRAFVIPKNGETPSEKELQSFVAEKVASFKKIEEVVFVDNIPKTNTGKILRKDLKKMYA